MKKILLLTVVILAGCAGGKMGDLAGMLKGGAKMFAKPQPTYHNMLHLLYKKNSKLNPEAVGNQYWQTFQAREDGSDDFTLLRDNEFKYKKTRAKFVERFKESIKEAKNEEAYELPLIGSMGKYNFKKKGFSIEELINSKGYIQSEVYMKGFYTNKPMWVVPPNGTGMFSTDDDDKAELVTGFFYKAKNGKTFKSKVLPIGESAAEKYADDRQVYMKAMIAVKGFKTYTKDHRKVSDVFIEIKEIHVFKDMQYTKFLGVIK